MVIQENKIKFTKINKSHVKKYMNKNSNISNININII